jgi:hypothetical protein
MGLKVDTIQNPSSATVNLTLDTSGNVTVGGNLTVPALIPSGSTVPTNGIYLSAANTLALSTNSTNRAIIDSSGNLQVGGSTVANTAGYVNSRTNARAWVKFTGSTGAILASYNVASVTRTAAGLFTIAFTTALADANYVPFITGSSSGSAGSQPWGYVSTGVTQAVGSFGIAYQSMGAAGATYTNVDPTSGFVIVFGN